MRALAIAGFELAQRRRLISTYVYVAIFFAIGLLWMAAAGGVFEGASVNFGSKVYINAPLSLMIAGAVISAVSITMLSTIFAQTIGKDFEHDLHPLFFTTPVRTSEYFFGRFLGAFVSFAFISLTAFIGLFLGCKLPGIDPEHLGPTRLFAFAAPWLLVTLPNAFFLGAVFFSVAGLTRRAYNAQIASVALIVAWLASSRALSSLDNRALADLLDPFSITAISHLADYWSVAEKKTLLVPLVGRFLLNRVLWTGGGAALLAVAFARFSRAHALREGKRDPAPGNDTARIERPSVSLDVSTAAMVRRLPALAWLELKASVRHRSFIIMVLAGTAFMIVAARSLGEIFETPTYPVTYLMLEVVAQQFNVFFLAATTFFAGDLLWREREAKMQQMTDALPVPAWIVYSQKLLALIGLQVLLTLVILLVSVGFQLSVGYHRLELWLYVRDLFGVELPQFMALAVLSLFIQLVLNDKYVGATVIVLFYVFTQFMPTLGLQHHLYDFGGLPPITYSDMNGFGHYVRPTVWFTVYWLLADVALIAVSHVWLQRGSEGDFKQRFASARQRFGRGSLSLFVVAMCGFVSIGGYIFYNTNVLNHYRTRTEHEDLAAHYEREYRRFATLPILHMTSVKLAVDIDPAARHLHAHGDLQVTNAAAEPIKEVLVNVSGGTQVNALTLEHAVVTSRDPDIGAYVMTIDPPLLPGETRPFVYDFDVTPRGFRNDGENDRLVENGTFYDSDRFVHFGYQRDREISQDAIRKKHGLEKRENSMPAPDALGAAMVNGLAPDADFIDFSAIVSTSDDQIAIAPGYLRREWHANGRHYFEYTMDAPIANLFSIQSGRYEVLKDKWHDVNLEIYYHATHTYNLQHMLEGVKSALDYMTANFSPYQHRQVRIIEFPRYESIAESFPNTIPFSESIGFIAHVDPDSDTDIDYPFYVSAHEVAHQWWAHQLVPADAQGANFITESLAEYSALMVMKHIRGDEQMLRFTRRELDAYLRGRGGERNHERPLLTVEDQPYIHYAKGALELYALQDIIGEKTLNAAIAGYLHGVAMKGPPYPTSTAFLAAVREATPVQARYFIADAFERIVLYDNRTKSAIAEKRADGKYDIKLKYSARKFEADGLGEEHDEAMHDFVDVGVVNEDKSVTVWRKTLPSGDGEITLTVDALPEKAGIDPLHKLIDKKPDDNMVNVGSP